MRDTVPVLRQKVEMITPYVQLAGIIKPIAGRDSDAGDAEPGGKGGIQELVVLEASEYSNPY